MWKRIIAARIPLFRFAGIQVNLDYSWFVIFGLVTWSLSVGYFPLHSRDMSMQDRWTAGLVTSILFFLSIVLHEIAHSLVAIRAGISIKAITLYLFGGASHLVSEPKTPRTEFAIASAGPLVSVLLGIMLHAVRLKLPHEAPGPVFPVIFFLGWINISIGVFNLVPAFPLDGGRMLRAVVWWKTGSPGYSIKLSTDMGKVFSLTLMALGLIYVFTRSALEGVFLILIGFFLRSMAYAAMEGFSINHSLGEMTVRNVMNRNLVNVGPDIPIDRLVREYMKVFPHSEFPVVEGNSLLGAVSLEKLMHLSEDERTRSLVRDIAIPFTQDHAITDDISLTEAFGLMEKTDTSRLFIMVDGLLSGILNRKGVIRLLELRRARDGMEGSI